MYISELNIHGFKSFAKKEKLKFGEGVTVIVGPNGCGKTNIVDAIRWVLGEQKYSVLRSGKMGDVIFNGADNLKPLSVCEAFLTVHNNKGKLPVEYNDVEIGRRIYRNGESEYFINRTPCRLKDIHNLFVDTGMGSDAYSVIELKMIEQILSETADDRKRMFEEAAGINKYKQQRRSAMRKFDAVGQDLDRINDIVQEVEQKVHSLNLQLKRYKRHEKLNDELKDKEIALAYIKVHNHEAEIAPLRKEVLEYLHLKDEKVTDSNVYEEKLTQLKKLYIEQQSDLGSLQKVIGGLEDDRESFQNKILVWSEQDKASRLNIERLKNEFSSSDEKKTQLKKQISINNNEINLILPKVESLLNKYKTKKTNFTIVEDKYKDSQQNLEIAQNTRWEAEKKIADNRSLLDRTQSLLLEKNENLSAMNNKIKVAKTEEKNQRKVQKELELQKVSISKDKEIVGKELDSLQDQLNEFKKTKSDLEMKIHKDKSSLSNIKSQLSFYEELVSQKDGYPSGVRTVLNNPKKYSGIIGTVGDLFHMDEKYNLAFQAALGEWSKCLVSKDRNIALNILSDAEKDQVGNLSILPLKEISESKFSSKDVPIGDCILGSGLSLSGVNSEHEGLAHALVSNLVIVEDLKVALKTHNLEGWNVVDLNGAYYGDNFLLKHKGKNKEGGLLGRTKKIKLLKNSINELIIQNNNDNKSLSVLLKTIEVENSKLDLLIDKQDNLSVDLSKIENSLIQNHFKQSQNLEIIKELNQDLVDIKKQIKDLKDSENKLVPSLSKSEESIKELLDKVDQCSKILISMQAERDTFQQAVQELRIELLNFENKRDSINFQKQVASETIEELDKRQKIIDNEILELVSKRKSLKEQILKSDSELKSISGKLVKERSVLKLKHDTVNDTYQSMEEIQNTIRSEQQSREALLEELKINELKIVEQEQRINIIKERIKDRYSMDIPSDLIVDDDLDDLELRVEQIMRSIDSIGPINMAVQYEYEEEQKRLKTLIEQRIDLTTSEENLRETIQQIDRVARKKFQETFDNIKLNFAKLFGMFFEGGTATLSLIGDPDPLEADISIHAQPPGKNNQSLRMLSAGEKSLTAIALLFAIYQYKPSPYCILDEVDAPLDDVNIQKFKRVLNSFADETQFIVVTHNKLTMEVADYLYGVTMEQKGVSKLVSVKFDE
ncbi:MAG: chromosome segregation protein SMC [Candidatus Marinimicrobia bacterium]|nr:chromosome segregation protein SMC [Candidatus Neomarinimicrobiota bacterium]